MKPSNWSRRWLHMSTRMVALMLVGILALLGGCDNGGTLQRQPVHPTPSPPASPALVTIPSPPPPGCAVTPVQLQSFPSEHLGQPWLQADPTSSGITAHLFYGLRPLHTGGQFSDGAAAKILWVITNPGASTQLEITGRNLSNDQGAYHESFPAAADPADNYPSIINVSTPGCWQFTLMSGTVVGTMVFWVVNN
jgi:hypothetical protein